MRTAIRPGIPRRPDHVTINRIATVAVLLAVAVVGLRASGTFSHAPHAEAAGFSGAALVTTLAAAEGVALIAFLTVLAMARPRRRPRQAEEPPRLRLPWWVKIFGVLASVFAVGAPLALLLARHTSHRTPTPFLVHPGGISAGSPHPASSAGGWSLIAGMALALVVVTTLALRSRRRAARPRTTRGGLAQSLAQSLAGARAALEAGRTPRQAIIACYTAMEHGFAAAGSAPAAADTPAEVLTRAAQAGILRSASAETLTGLFRRARYSDEPMTGADSAAAAGALARMQAELGERS